MRAIIRAAIALVVATTFAGMAHAQQTEAAFRSTTLNLSAQGETRTKPDIVTFSVGVAAEAATAKAASAESAGKVNEIVRSLRSAGIAQSDIQTQSVQLEPRYSDRSNSPREIVAQQATTTLVVTVRDLDRAGSMLDLAVAAGANRVNGVRFGLANPQGAQRAARDSALRALQENASQIADAMGYRVVRLVNVSTAAYANDAVVSRRIEEVIVTASRIEPGELIMRGQASAVFELTPK